MATESQLTPRPSIHADREHYCAYVAGVYDGIISITAELSLQLAQHGISIPPPRPEDIKAMADSNWPASKQRLHGPWVDDLESLPVVPSTPVLWRPGI